MEIRKLESEATINALLSIQERIPFVISEIENHEGKVVNARLANKINEKLTLFGAKEKVAIKYDHKNEIVGVEISTAREGVVGLNVTGYPYAYEHTVHVELEDKRLVACESFVEVIQKMENKISRYRFEKETVENLMLKIIQVTDGFSEEIRGLSYIERELVRQELRQKLPTAFRGIL